MNLPIRSDLGLSGSPRASALRTVALALAKGNPSLARTAMNAARELTQDLEPFRQAFFLRDVPEFYLKLGDEDGARGAVKAQMKLAEKLYALDADPNLAFKGAWPSSNAWRTCIQQATKISPNFAEEILAEIPDPEIAGFQRVIYANSLLGATKSNITVCECHKDGKISAIYGGP